MSYPTIVAFIICQHVSMSVRQVGQLDVLVWPHEIWMREAFKMFSDAHKANSQFGSPSIALVFQSVYAQRAYRHVRLSLICSQMHNEQSANPSCCGLGLLLHIVTGTCTVYMAILHRFDAELK